MEKFNLDITIEKKTGSQDTFGQPSTAWTTHLITYASMITTGGREFYAAQKLHAETTALFKMWYEPGITTEMRIKYGSRYFDIINVNDVNEEHKVLLISCKEVI